MKKREKSDNLLKWFKRGTRRKPIGSAVKPQLILTKHKQLCTISYNTLLPSVDASVSEFFKSKGIKKGHFILKIK